TPSVRDGAVFVGLVDGDDGLFAVGASGGGRPGVVVTTGGEQQDREQQGQPGERPGSSLGRLHQSTWISVYMPWTMCGGPSPTSGGPSEVAAAARYSSGSTPVGMKQVRRYRPGSASEPSPMAKIASSLSGGVRMTVT